jgi:thiamine biosynthesis protein ThiI
MTSVVVHYQEIALKGKNRPWFIHRLVQNLRGATEDLDVRQVHAVMGRIELVLGPGVNWEELRARLQTVFGIANFSKAGRTSSDLERLGDAILADLDVEPPASFMVAARRSDKRYPLPSPVIEQVLGARIKGERGWTVNLSRPAFTIYVEVLKDQAFYYFGKERGAGGLPTGVGGRVACLLSGGIDSPVAAWRIMRRGCRAQLIHFHAYPIVSTVSQEKARELSRVLTRYQQRTRLYLVPFGDVQRRVVLGVPGPLRVIVYRRLMLRIAGRLAAWEGSRALVTGDSIGQVASQTLENLTVIDAAATLPVLRPLVGMDKEEVTADAHRIGTYEISILPDEDCCQLFTPRSPATRARLAQVDAAEASLPVADLIDMAVRGAVVEDFKGDWSRLDTTIKPL